MMNSVRKTLLLTTAVAVALTQFVAYAAEDLLVDTMSQPHHSAKVSAIPDDSIAFQKDAGNLRQSLAAQPLIMESGDRLVASPLLKDMQDTLLRMNDLSYNLVKGGGKYLEFSTHELENLQKEGWVVRSFTGLEGDRSTYEDLSGIVCYHRAKNVITVVYHGTANNAEGWETNFDGSRIKGNKIKNELTKDLIEETFEVLKGVHEASSIAKLNDFLINMKKSKTFGTETIVQAQHMIEKLMVDNKIEAEIGNRLLHNFRMKVELSQYLEKTGCKIEGDVHKGFAKKYYSTKPDVLALMKDIIDTLTPEQKKNVKVVFSGHSQAGGTGSLALADITANHGKELFGPDFDNKKSGTFNGYFLSGARTGDEEYANWVHKHVGKDYIARQNVAGDPVPVALVDEEVQKIVLKIPALGKILVEAAGGYADTGHLLYEDGAEVGRRANALFVEEGLSIDEFSKLDTFIRDLLSFKLNKEDIPQALISNSVSSSWNPVAKLQNLWNNYKIGQMIYSAAQGDKQSQAMLDQLLTMRFGHFHYGHFKKETGTAGFDPKIIGRDLDKYLEYGRQHELTKENALQKAKEAEKQASRDKTFKNLKKDNEAK